MDGGSTDGTVDLLKELEEKEPGRISWMSEKDNGIYDGINKGICMATGEIVGCCFDRYADEGVLMRMVEIMEKEGTDGVHGDLCYMDGDRIVRKWHAGQGVIRSGWMAGHPTLYLKKEVYDRFGLYRTDYRISGDYEFMVRILYRKEVTLSYLPEITDLYVPWRYQHQQSGGLCGIYDGRTPGAGGKSCSFCMGNGSVQGSAGAVTVCHPVRSVVQ